MLGFTSLVGVVFSFIAIYLLNKRGLGLNKQMIVAAVFGILISLALQALGKNISSGSVSDIYLFRFIYSIYINLLLFIVAPLIFFSVISSVIGINNFESLKRMGVKIISIFAGTAIVASTIGLSVAYFMKPFFKGANTLSERTLNTDSFLEHVLKLFPKNIVADFASNKIIAIVLAALLFGCVIVYLSSQTKNLQTLVKEINIVMFKVVGIFIKLSPYSIVAIIAHVIITYGWSSLVSLLPFAVAVYLAMIIHFIFTYGSLVRFGAKISFLRFISKASPATLFAFYSSSSAATLPVTISTLQDMGVSKDISRFVPSLGATMNMNACGAIFPAVTAIFTAQVFGIDLDFTSYVVIVIMSMLASLGTAGVPGAAVVMTTVVLSSVGLPLEGLLMVLTIDRLIDMGRTSLNVTGDLVASVVVANSEDELNKDVFYS